MRQVLREAAWLSAPVDESARMRHGSGASFGEVALVDKSARSATVTATSPVRAYGLPVWSFRSFAEARPVVLWKLLELLAERLRAAEHR